MFDSPCHSAGGSSYPKNKVHFEWDYKTDIFSVKGIIKNRLSWSLWDIRLYVESFSTHYLFCCNPNHQPLRDIEWVGIFTRKLIEIVEPLPRAKTVIAEGMDGHSAKFPMEKFSKKNNIIAIAAGSEYLSPEQGGPIRLIMSNLGGWCSVKALKTLDFEE
jgi:DMSO/TMAO reductase YedYZ molybdopterin-dependent catalytic subunit